MFRLKVALARAVRRLSRWSRRGGGTSLPGKVLLRLAPDAVARLGRQLERGSVIVSATNGKTTTAGMIASVLAQAGITTAHNRAGANMPGGVATALLERTRRARVRGAQLGLFEVDEAWVGPLVAELRPHTVILANLFRDQLDRYGELEKLADGWAALVEEHAEQTTFVLNADDPLVADLGRNSKGEPRPRVVYFGVADRSHALAEPEHAFDAKHCRRCGASYRYSATYLGHLGDYECPSCGARRPEPSVTAQRVELRGMADTELAMSTPAGTIQVALPLPGLYNVYNALAATACCLSLGIDAGALKRGLESFATAFGRAERLQIGSRELSILLIKNPAGANEVFRTLVARRPQGSERDSGDELDLWIALNDRIADGRDISWIWDTEFEMLAGHARHVVCSGTRAEELALRLKYAGLSPDRLEVVPALDAALEHSIRDGGAPLYALPTYTALIELRELLAARGDARPYWESR